MAHVHLTKDDISGSHQWEGGLVLLNIVMIGISDELPEHDDKYELHRLLSATLSMELSVDEKLGHLSMIFDAKWQNFCVRKIPMPMLV